MLIGLLVLAAVAAVGCGGEAEEPMRTAGPTQAAAPAAMSDLANRIDILCDIRDRGSSSNAQAVPGNPLDKAVEQLLRVHREKTTTGGVETLKVVQRRLAMNCELYRAQDVERALAK